MAEKTIELDIVAQMRKDRGELERAVTKLTTEFEAKWSVQVSRLEMIRDHTLGQQYTRLIGVRAETELE